MLAHHFLGKYAGEFGKKVTGISTPAMELLLAHSWPGNARELENTIERAVAVAEGEEIGVQDMMTFTVSTEARGFDPSLPCPATR